ncbi:MAG: NADH-quinone oxidoreductase subunit NuoK [Dehalococcoidia bacterium]|nr:NADH-quinone oxidoreductase subunit NuoK [Dehalococcoidia bacterium]
MIEIGLSHYMVLSAVLFSIGLYGVLSRRNAVGVLMSVELLLNSVNIALIAIGRYVGGAGATGQVFALFVITVAAAEASVALALLIAIYRDRGAVDVESATALQG